MNHQQTIDMIRMIIKQELASVYMATVQSNQSSQRVSASRFNTDPGITNMRSIQPFGLSSRAPVGTEALTIPVNHDPTHINLVGHFDKNKPDMADGETVLYDAFGHVIYLSQSKMQFGSKASAENMVLGQVFKTMMDTLLTAIATHKHVGNLGYETSPPENASDFTTLKSSPIDDNAILSNIAFTEKG